MLYPLSYERSAARSTGRPPRLPARDDVVGPLLARRIVMLSGPPDAATADDVSGRLLLLDQRGDAPITLHVACAEADLDATLGLLAAIDLVAAPIHAIAAGSVGG